MPPMIYTLYGFAMFFFVYWCALWLLHIIAILYGKYRLHNKVELPPDEPFPGVSIIKPLMGVDVQLYPNLETFFTMIYPSFEILFCVEDENDAAIKVVEELVKKYPKVQTRIFTGGSCVGVNPKINNMNAAYEASSYDLILISDSGIRMKEDTLKDMVSNMKENVAIVHQMPFTYDRSGFAAILEKVYFGTAQSRMYLCADFFKVNCHTGMSTLIRKQALEEKGGLKSFGCYLAEDFFISKSFIESGWKTVISSHPALQNSGLCDVASFQERLKRWAKLRVAMIPFVIIGEPLSECLVIGACGAWAAGILFNCNFLPFYLIHILVWFLFDWLLLRVVQNGSLPFTKFDFVKGWIAREWLGPYLFLSAVFSPSIRWRNRTFKLQWGGLAEEVKPRMKC